MKRPERLRRVLLPLDGSEPSLGAVRYITKIDPLHLLHVVLFHVYGGAPESFYDLGKDPRSTSAVTYVKAWEHQQKINATHYMQKARGILLRAGFPETAVTVTIQKRRRGIARDIIAESRRGYDAVVARRRGLGALKGVVLGSVANKLLQKLDFLPLLLVGRRAAGGKILLGFDGSRGAMGAVRFVGAALGRSDAKVCLLQVIRAGAEEKPADRDNASGRKKIYGAIDRNAPQMNEAREVLITSGFQPNRISVKTIVGAKSRAASIVAEAKRNDCGTIVLGRRGFSRVREFFIGRVTNKVIHLADDRTVWVVR